MVVVGGALGDGFGTVLVARWPILENPEGPFASRCRVVPPSRTHGFGTVAVCLCRVFVAFTPFRVSFAENIKKT